jgi:hypothetical protein
MKRVERDMTRIFAAIGIIAIGLCIVAAIAGAIYWLMPPKCSDASVLQALEDEFGQTPGIRGLRIQKKLFSTTDMGRDDKGRQQCYSTFINVFDNHGLGLGYTIVNRAQVEITKTTRL